MKHGFTLGGFYPWHGVFGVKGVLGAKPQPWRDWVAMMLEGIPAAAVEPIIGAMHLSQAQSSGPWHFRACTRASDAGKRSEQRRIVQAPLLGSGSQPRA